MTDDERDFERSAEDLERAKRRRVIDEARATVSRLKREERQRRDDASTLPPEDLARKLIPSAPVDRVARWREDAERRIAERKEVRAQERARDDLIYRQFERRSVEPADEKWNEWLTSYVERRLEAERELTMDLVGTVVGELFDKHVKDEHRDAEFASEIARLWRSVAESQRQIANAVRDRGVDAMRDVAVDLKTVN